jgi:hypothetical protein
MSRTCVFCGGTPVNKEHALPRWLGRLFTDVVVEFSRTFEYSGAEREVRAWRGQPFSARVGGPCVACNSGWMSALEQEARPLLIPLVRNHDVQLNAVGQHVVATWAVKTMLMLRLVAADDDDRELDLDVYGWIHRTRSPPPAEQVWIASYAGEGQWPATFHYYGAAIGRPGGAQPQEPNAHCASFAVGHLAFGFAGHRLKDGPMAVPTLPPDTIRQLWPAFGPTIDFPPPAALAGDSEMLRLATPGEWVGPP